MQDACVKAEVVLRAAARLPLCHTCVGLSADEHVGVRAVRHAHPAWCAVPSVRADDAMTAPRFTRPNRNRYLTGQDSLNPEQLVSHDKSRPGSKHRA